MGKYTSRVFAVERALFDLLKAQTWPIHPMLADLPLVCLGALANPPAETVVVAGLPAVAPAQSTATNRSRDEVFTFRVVVESWVHGRTAVEVSERLEELCDVVQDALRDSLTGALTPSFNGQSPSHPVPGVISWAVAATRPRHWTLDEGSVGAVDIDVEFKTHI